MTLTVAVASDHAGLEMRRRLRDALEEWGYAVLDLGPDATDAVDYPDYAEAVALRVSGGQAARGVLVCGTGVGMSISANKFPNVRAALLYDDFTARHARLHNDANVAVFGSRTMKVDAAVARLRIFLSEPFEKGRHARRVEKINGIEKRLGLQA
ncbi:MAG: ribose 5-phosphate isomerase B [Deltaproteobacteria bacterium RBG_16_64_85]|nr:MAG: ribose 5-phosphate isomerase B [Deltaproteobacteria bacterium RBG_16_64_85]